MKIFAIVSVILIVVGLVICGIALFGSGFDFEKMEKTAEETFTLSEEIKNIEIKTDGVSCDIIVKRADTEKAELFIKYRKNTRIEYTVTDGKLAVNTTREKKFQLFDFGVRDKIILTLPAKTYESLNIENSTGDVRIANLDFSGGVCIENSTGDINIASIKAQSLSAKASTGDIEGRRLYAEEKMSVSVSTGEISLSEINADTFSSNGEIEIEKATLGAIELMKGSTDSITLEEVYTTGNVNIEISTGDIEIENSRFGGKLTAKGSTGDFEMINSDAYELDVNYTTGDVNLLLLSPKNFVTDSSTGKIDVIGTVYTAPLCKITTSTGKITVRVSD